MIQEEDYRLLRGDIVSSRSDPFGQIGTVVDFNITVDLLAQDGSILKDVPSSDLRRIRDFHFNDSVVFGSWFGMIMDVCEDVAVQLDDGSVFEVPRADPLLLKPNYMMGRGHFVYYPGERVKATSALVFKNSTCLSGLSESWKANSLDSLEGTVTKLTISSVSVSWFSSASVGLHAVNPPDKEQSPENLKLLSWFVPTSWDVRDWCFPPLETESIADSHASASKDCDADLKASLSKTGDDKEKDCKGAENFETDRIDKKKVRKNVESFETAVLIININRKKLMWPGRMVP